MGGLLQCIFPQTCARAFSQGLSGPGKTSAQHAYGLQWQISYMEAALARLPASAVPRGNLGPFLTVSGSGPSNCPILPHICG